MFVIIAPTCWFGSPHDFWWLAPTALTATATACVAIMVRFANPSKEDHCQANSHSLYFEFSMTSAPITTIPRESIDSHDSGSCYTNTTTSDPPLEFDPVFPPPEDFNGFGEGNMYQSYFQFFPAGARSRFSAKTGFRRKTGRSRAICESIRKIPTGKITEILVASQPLIRFFPLMA